jgi:integrase
LLTSRELRKWRDDLVKAPPQTARWGRRKPSQRPVEREERSLAPATINRTCVAFKAALNLAAEHDEQIANHRAWDSGLASIPDAEQSRNVILPEAEVRTLVEKARNHSPAFGLLVEAAAVTGARVSQLARVEVQDLQANRREPRLMMPTSRKGRGTKRVLRRPVPIPSELATRLHTLAADRPHTAPLFVKPSGAPWKKSDHSRLFARAVEAADQDPDKVTMYALRHSNIVRQLLAGVPIRVVAVNHDTSIAMLERTYSRHIGDYADALARGALLDMSEPAIDDK